MFDEPVGRLLGGPASALEAGVIETLKYTVKSSEIVRDPAWFLELARQTYGLRMIATGGRFREILQVEKPETDEDLIGADMPAKPISGAAHGC